MHAAQQEIARLNAALVAASSSSSSSAPPPGAQQRGAGEHMRPMKPSTFSGATGNTAEQWLAEMERYFLAAGVEDHPRVGTGRVLFASTFLKESASSWLNSLWSEDEREEGLRHCSWAEFKEKFRARYRPLAAERTARMVLRTLKQRSRVAGYSDAFLKQAQLLPNMDEADKVAAYIDGLLPKIADEVDRDDPQTLIDAMNLAQRAEIRQASRNASRSHPTFNRSYNYGGGQPAFYSRSGGTSSSASARPAGDAMDLSALGADGDGDSQPESGSEDERHVERINAVQQRGGARRSPPRRGGPRVPDLSREEFDRLSREGKCFLCRQLGHLARNCPRANGPGKPGSKPSSSAPLKA